MDKLNELYNRVLGAVNSICSFSWNTNKNEGGYRCAQRLG